MANLAAAEKVMSKEIEKLGYCVRCDENVAHRRGKAKGLREFVGDLLQRLHLGRWHCVQCQNARYFLPFASEGTVDYQIDEPNDTENAWKLDGPTRLAVGADDFSEDWGPADRVVSESDQNPQLVPYSAHEARAIESSNDAQRGDFLDLFDFSKEDVFCREPEDDLFCEEREDESVLAAVEDSTVSGELIVESPRDVSDQRSEFVVAEPVGNFIKDRSLVVEATRLKRFTEKYRDALVDRILSGKTQVSWLIADGKYTEAELTSWIADKARRQTAEQDPAIELDAVFRKRN